jgi:hypothetical protein
MNQRYFLIEPKYRDPDVFCNFIMGSNRVRASIQIYADLEMLLDFSAALEMPVLEREFPQFDARESSPDDQIFAFLLSVLPHEDGNRVIRCNVIEDLLDDGAPYRADIRFELTPDEANEFSRELKSWCAQPADSFIWKGD